MAKDIATARRGATVLGFGNVDVRKIESLEQAVAKCVKQLGGIDYVMFVYPTSLSHHTSEAGFFRRRC